MKKKIGKYKQKEKSAKNKDKNKDTVLKQIETKKSKQNQ